MFLQALGAYLDVKTENGELDVMYAYARASLLTYARWMALNETPYLSRPERLEYPTETWHAQDMRKSDVFKFAAKHAVGSERELFLERANFFFDMSVDGLLTSKTRTLARPVVIMMTCGYMHAYFQSHPQEAAPPPVRAEDFGSPETFVSQRDRIASSLKACCGFALTATLLRRVATRAALKA